MTTLQNLFILSPGKFLHGSVIKTKNVIKCPTTQRVNFTRQYNGSGKKEGTKSCLVVFSEWEKEGV